MVGYTCCRLDSPFPSLALLLLFMLGEYTHGLTNASTVITLWLGVWIGNKWQPIDMNGRPTGVHGSNPDMERDALTQNCSDGLLFSFRCFFSAA